VASQQNVEMVREANEAFNRGDFAGMFAGVAHPDFEYTTSGLIPGAMGVYRGTAGYARFLEELWAEFDDVRSQIEEVIEVEDQLAVSLTIRARGKQSQVETRWTFTQLWTLREGKVLRGQGFTTRERALEAAGLEE
jgi:ketosteroid isomerase-like protein